MYIELSSDLVADYYLYSDIALEHVIGVGISVCTLGGELIPVQCQTSFRFDEEENPVVPHTLATQGITDFGRGFSIVTGGTGPYDGATGYGWTTVFEAEGARRFEYWFTH